jgi:hypothetical protein
MADVVRKQVRDGEWIRPVMTGYLMECCTCGTVHLMDFRIHSERGFEMRGFRVEKVKDDATE